MMTVMTTIAMVPGWSVFFLIAFFSSPVDLFLLKQPHLLLLLFVSYSVLVCNLLHAVLSIMKLG